MSLCLFIVLESGLLGLRNLNVTDHHFLKVSFAGGLAFFNDSAGYDDLPHLNSVLFNPTSGESAIMKGAAFNGKSNNIVPF